MGAVENIITDNLPIWSSAIQSKSSAGRGTSSKRNLYGVKKLRELILDLAVRGLLVPQDPSEEPASVLLEKITTEKERLVKEGKIKKQKLVTPLQGLEFLSHCPEGWVITSISEIAQVQPKNELSEHKDVGFVEMSSISSDHKGSHEQEVRRWLKVKKGYTHIKDGDIGLAKVTPCFENSKAAIFKGLENGFGAATTELHTARFFGDEIVQDFVLYHLKSAKFLSLGKSRMTGTSGLKRVPKDYFFSYPITLAPAPEQHRIVAKVDELMALCDTLEQQQEDSIQAHETLVEVLLEALSNAVDADAFQAAWGRISEHFDVLFTTDHSINKLKETILQLAVMGKLVPQDPNDEPASVLLEKIAAEKERLVKEGKIKKKKSSPDIDENKKNFKVPSNWRWVRLDSISEFINGYAFKSSDFKDNGIGVVKIGDIQNGIISAKNMSRVSSKVVEPLNENLKISKHDMVIAMSGATTGKLGFSLSEETYYLNQRVGKIVTHICDPKYIYFPLTTKILENLAQSRGMAIPNLSTAQINEIVLALPPLAEQHRIVAKVDELMGLCDTLEQQQEDSIQAHETLVEVLLEALSNAVDADAFQAAWAYISKNFDALFTTDHSINKLKETILQLAVMGKLVPQDPSDEPASVLLEKIAAEKERLVNEGKIKKQKLLPKVSDEEKLDLISENWQTSRLGNLGVTSTGKTPSTSNSEFFVGNIPFVGPGQITPTGNWIKSDKRLSDKGLQQSSEANPNDILMVCIGGSIGKSAIALEKIAFNQQINAIKPLFIEPRYLKFAISTKRFQRAIIDNSSGSATPIINRSKWEALVVPIPPLAEQHRIVAKVDEMMALCDKLKNSLQQAQETQILLTDAVVENAL